jgi:hypothetical protein
MGTATPLQNFLLWRGLQFVVYVVQSASAMNLFFHTSNTNLLMNVIPFKVVFLRLYAASPVILHHSELCMKCIIFNLAILLELW